MLVHCTQRLAAKLPLVSKEPLVDANPLGSWHANLYIIDRRNCIMFCHDRTRFVLFAAGLKKSDFARLDFWFQDIYANTRRIGDGEESGTYHGLGTGTAQPQGDGGRAVAVRQTRPGGQRDAAYLEALA